MIQTQCLFPVESKLKCLNWLHLVIPSAIWSKWLMVILANAGFNSRSLKKRDKRSLCWPISIYLWIVVIKGINLIMFPFIAHQLFIHLIQNYFIQRLRLSPKLLTWYTGIESYDEPHLDWHSWIQVLKCGFKCALSLLLCTARPTYTKCCTYWVNRSSKINLALRKHLAFVTYLLEYLFSGRFSPPSFILRFEVTDIWNKYWYSNFIQSLEVWEKHSQP